MAGNTGEIVRRPAVPRPIRIRRSVLSLPPNDPILVFYGKAMAEMLPRPIKDFNSWRYQAAIHDYVRAQDPKQIANEALPPDADVFWRACEHQNWFFLPWHRMYLFHFEQIVLHEVIRLGGPTDWALPYWNYSASAANAKLLPEAFRSGSTTGLFVPNRDPNANAGSPFMQGDPTNIAGLTDPQFVGVLNGSPGFGGLQPRGPLPAQLPESRKNHGGGVSQGRVEASPHNGIHSQLNGPNSEFNNAPLNVRGWMGNFTRAPLDPIFWVHHCNIDRLWEVWAHTAGHANPTNPDWLTAIKWAFRDVNGNRVDMKAADVLDTRAQLFYEYDDISNPFSP